MSLVDFLTGFERVEITGFFDLELKCAAACGFPHGDAACSRIHGSDDTTSFDVLSIFGPTDPLQWAPVGTKNRYIHSRDGNINSLTPEEVYAMMQVILYELKKIATSAYAYHLDVSNQQLVQAAVMRLITLSRSISLSTMQE